jgi:tetrapyrrole methylase family protein/MazG family protein
MIAQDYQKRVVRTGFEFTDVQDAYSKLEEELQELREAVTQKEQLEELGDILFMVAKLGTLLKIDAEEALRQANRKFRQRFEAMEAIARQEERELISYSTEEWLALWQRAKIATNTLPDAQIQEMDVN